jgi:hypothetical protein
VLLVNAPLAALFEFEVFDCVSDVHIRTVDTRIGELADPPRVADRALDPGLDRRERVAGSFI